MADGYWGKVLSVDLSSGAIESLALPDELYRQYWGGYGLAARVLYERIQRGADPLGPDNVLALMPGLLTGTGAPFSGRFMVAAKSPLTGGWGDANGGGKFGPAVRGAGLDGVFVRGSSSRPVYLYIDTNGAELRDASTLWGLDTVTTAEALAATIASDVQVACIGPAGEQRSLISGVVNDGGRIAARCGLGAVMGAKNLKAVAVRGKGSPPLADKDGFRSSTASYRQLFGKKPSTWVGMVPRFLHLLAPLMGRLRVQFSGAPTQMAIDTYRLYGTAAGTALLVAMGDTPIRNWAGSQRDYPVSLAAQLSDDAVIRDKVKSYACHSCPLACGAMIRLADGGTGHRPEYETLASFGPTVMNSDLGVVVACNEICNRAGLDTIAVGVVIGFAMECFERGWLPPELSGEMDLPWGDGAAVVELTRRIASRQSGLGDWLADGVARAADRLGPEAQEAAIHAGGQALPMHRGLYEPHVALGYQVDPAPGRHTASNSGIASAPGVAKYVRLAGRQLAGRYDYAGKGPESAILLPVMRALDALGVCMFSLAFGDPPFLSWLRAATGWDVDEAEWLMTGRRIQAVRHAFNAREGVPSGKVSLPARERGAPPQHDGPLAGQTLDMDSMARGYFQAMGIDAQTGWPRGDTVAELGLQTLLGDGQAELQNLA